MNNHLKRAYNIGAEQALDEAVKRLPPGPNIAGKTQELSFSPAVGGPVTQGANLVSKSAISFGVSGGASPDVAGKSGVGTAQVGV